MTNDQEMVASLENFITGIRRGLLKMEFDFSSDDPSDVLQGTVKVENGWWFHVERPAGSNWRSLQIARLWDDQGRYWDYDTLHRVRQYTPLWRALLAALSRQHVTGGAVPRPSALDQLTSNEIGPQQITGGFLPAEPAFRIFEGPRDG